MNPVVADPSGLFAPVYLNTATFKVDLRTSADVEVQTIDPCFGQLVAGGTFGFGDGSVGSPAISFSNDPDTGIYRIGANDAALVAGGATILEWSGNGVEIKDTLFALKDNSDTSKKVKFELSGVTTATTRTLTVPDTDGTIATTATVGLTQIFQSNVGIAASVAASALTISLKGIDGTDPSASNVVNIPFRNATIGTGQPVVRSVTSGKSITVASTKTLGTSNATAFRIWLLAVDTGSDIELGVVNCLSGTTIMALRNSILYSPTATPGNSAQVIYTNSGQSSKPICILGYLDFSSGEATAGTWATAPDKIQVFQPGGALPGDTVQVQRNDTGAVATGTTTIPHDDTIPQSGEGVQFMTQSITPTAAANLLRVRSTTNLSSGASGTPNLIVALFRDSTASALTCDKVVSEASAVMYQLVLDWPALAAATASTTFKIRGGSSSAGTTTFNGEIGARIFGGAINSFLEVTEIMA